MTPGHCKCQQCQHQPAAVKCLLPWACYCADRLISMQKTCCQVCCQAAAAIQAAAQLVQHPVRTLVPETAVLEVMQRPYMCPSTTLSSIPWSDGMLYGRYNWTELPGSKPTEGAAAVDSCVDAIHWQWLSDSPLLPNEYITQPFCRSLSDILHNSLDPSPVPPYLVSGLSAGQLITGTNTFQNSFLP